MSIVGPSRGIDRLARLCALALAAAHVLFAAPVPAAAQGEPRTERYGVETVVVADVDGPIGPATTLLVENALAQAARVPGGMLVLRMDTPGGLDAATRDIVAAILAAPVPVATWVAPAGARAASAGTYILYASHVAAMAQSTTLGAATPVSLGGGDPGDAASRKAINDSAAFIRGLAELRGRNAAFAEAAVREAETLTAADAVQDGVVEILADDLPAMLREASGLVVRLGARSVRLETDGAAIVSHEPGFLVEALALITNPNVAYILLLIGIYGIVFEFANPGVIFSGVVGAISLLLGLFALDFLPIDVTGVLLIALGIALMVAEVFVPAFGALGIGGAVAFGFGSFILFDTDVPGFSLSPAVAVAATLATVLLLTIVLVAAVRALRRRPASGDEALVDERARVLHWEAFAGEVEIHGERWRAVADEPLAPGEPVRVRARDGLTLSVARLGADHRDPDHRDPDHRDPDHRDPDHRDPDHRDPMHPAAQPPAQ
ncbi:NfeD family protein [Salinarimonas rosea]|uniref:NfeD family protein n=1 Tax=Salinarimonas rosea TaxID=552063 RepID=UPI000425BD4B|nr:nodulation protein NfeD [Salinarimonas rosea]